MMKRVIWRKSYREFPEEADTSSCICAERDRWKADEHGFCAAHRTMEDLFIHSETAMGTAHYSGEVLTGTC